jgi:hypothetical protein
VIVRFARWVTSPSVQGRYHGVSLVLALLLTPFIMLFGRNSLWVLMAVSLDTWLTDKASAWLAARAAGNDEESCT